MTNVNPDISCCLARAREDRVCIISPMFAVEDGGYMASPVFTVEDRVCIISPMFPEEDGV
ncbi:MAG: hypothetical protein VZQ80_10180 [Lachnospiraceae bacterium]|nr:hypothetical protein [Lachnospiraceae bacterium]